MYNPYHRHAKSVPSSIQGVPDPILKERHPLFDIIYWTTVATYLFVYPPSTQAKISHPRYHRSSFPFLLKILVTYLDITDRNLLCYCSFPEKVWRMTSNGTFISFYMKVNGKSVWCHSGRCHCPLINYVYKYRQRRNQKLTAESARTNLSIALCSVQKVMKVKFTIRHFFILEDLYGLCHTYKYTLLQKKRNFSEPIFPDDPGSLTLTPGHVYTTINLSTLFPKRNAPFHAAFLLKKSVDLCICEVVILGVWQAHKLCGIPLPQNFLFPKGVCTKFNV